MNKPKLIYFDAPVSRGEECRQHGLHPADDFEAARHEGMMEHVEDLRAAVVPTIGMSDAEKRVAREALVSGFLPAWASYAERNIPGAPFFEGGNIHVVDLKLHMAVRWFIGGKVDYIPATIFAGYPKPVGVYEAVRDHPGVKAWYSRG